MARAKYEAGLQIYSRGAVKRPLLFVEMEYPNALSI